MQEINRPILRGIIVNGKWFNANLITHIEVTGGNSASFHSNWRINNYDIVIKCAVYFKSLPPVVLEITKVNDQPYILRDTEDLHMDILYDVMEELNKVGTLDIQQAIEEFLDCAVTVKKKREKDLKVDPIVKLPDNMAFLVEPLGKHLSVRGRNILDYALDMRYVGDLVTFKISEDVDPKYKFLELDNFGPVCWNEVEILMRQKNLSFNTEVPAWENIRKNLDAGKIKNNKGDKN